MHFLWEFDLCGKGAFGAILAITGAGESLGRLFLQLSIPYIFVPFLVAAALHTIQRSRVMIMIIAPSLLLPLIPELGFPPEILSVYLLLLSSFFTNFSFTEGFNHYPSEIFPLF